MLGSIFKFAEKDVDSADEYCYGRLVLPARFSRSNSEESGQEEESASERPSGETHKEKNSFLPTIRLPAMRLELAHSVAQYRDYGGGVIAGLIVATIGGVLLLLLLV